SYRAQLAGWRFVFDPALEAPAELPAEIGALESQQRRWAKGSIQTARKLLPAVLRSRLSARAKLEAALHLTNNLAYPLLLLLGLLLLPVMASASTLPARVAIALDLAVIALGVVPVVLFLAAGQVARGVRGWRMLRGVAAAVVLGAGLSVNNGRAVLE